MRVYVVPAQVPHFSGFGAFGETGEEHCRRTYANCPDLMEKCLKPAGCLFGVCSQKPEPWTLVGKQMRGLPLNGQCPGGSAPIIQQPPVQQPQPGTNVVGAPGGPGPADAGGGVMTSFPPQSGAPQGMMDQLLANKPLLAAGAAVAGFLAWQALRRPAGRGAMNGYGSKRRTRRAKRIH